MPTVVHALQKRGFIEDITSDELDQFTRHPRHVYCGFDPTADSLHLGNLVAIMGLAWFQRYGHKPVVIVGGATGLIGDPSGKSHERPLLDEAVIQNNLKGITENFKAILDFDDPNTRPLILNNWEWLKDFSFVEFLRKAGRYFRMGAMLAKESVRNRLNTEEGMSFAEFSYQVLQSYDFYHLNQTYDVSIQIGGSDQWGNITAGKDFVRRLTGNTVHGLTFPLITRSDGKKFGKSESGAIWLSPKKLSPYEFYQYLFRTADQDVIKLMRMLTFMDIEEIQSIEKKMQSPDYVPNTAQKRLSEEVTRLVHGEEGLKKALSVTSHIRPGTSQSLDTETLEKIAHNLPTYTLSQDEIISIKLIDLLVNVGVMKSKGEARRLIRNKGLYLNEKLVETEDFAISHSDLIENTYLLVSLGKKNKILIQHQEKKE